MNLAPYLRARAPGSATASATASSSTRPSTTACGARSRTATWAPTPSASRSATTSAARTRTRSRSTSHQKAIAAIDAGRFDAEMAPVDVRDAKGRETIVERRRGPAPRLDRWRRSARLKPAFALPERRGPRRRDDRDASRPATRPGITDGAAATVVASERAVERLGLTPAGPDRRLRPGRGRAEVAVPRPDRGRPPAARPDRAADRGVRPHRDQRGVRRPDARRRPRARLRLGQGQRQRRRDRARPSDRRERGADRRDAPPRAAAGARAATASRRCASAAAARVAMALRARLTRRGRRAGLRLAAMTETAVETPDLPPLHRRRVGATRRRGATFESRNPADTRDVVGRFQQGTAADVAMAVRAAETRLPDVAPDAGPEARRDPVRASAR